MTGDDGRFRFQVTVPARFTLYTEKLGYVRDKDGVRGERKSGGAADPVEILLIQESRLEGRVVDRETGAPVQGMRVIAHGQWDKAGKGFLIPHGSSVTNEKGEFTIEKLAATSIGWNAVRPSNPGCCRQGRRRISGRLCGSATAPRGIRTRPAGRSRPLCG